MNTRAPDLVAAAFDALQDPRRITAVEEISANVSTNQVFRVQLDDKAEIIAKVSSYGSYVHFRQDHQLIQRLSQVLENTRYENFLARVIEKEGKVFCFREGATWVVFYEKAPFYDFLPKVLTAGQVRAMGHELAEFHQACERASHALPGTWKSLGSDIATLYDVVGSESWCVERGIDSRAAEELRRQCELFLDNAERHGYHQMAKIPVLVDWNIGNFSVGLDREGFRLYSRWDYDWFRIEPRALDLYFCARVCRSEGDQTSFSYSVAPFFDPRFSDFLRAYHEVYPLQGEELLFAKEAFRFFILNYVVRSGEHFFRPSFCERLLKEATTQYFYELEEADFSKLLQAIR